MCLQTSCGGATTCWTQMGGEAYGTTMTRIFSDHDASIFIHPYFNLHLTDKDLEMEDDELANEVVLFRCVLRCRNDISYLEAGIREVLATTTTTSTTTSTTTTNSFTVSTTTSTDCTTKNKTKGRGAKANTIAQTQCWVGPRCSHLDTAAYAQTRMKILRWMSCTTNQDLATSDGGVVDRHWISDGIYVRVCPVHQKNSVAAPREADAQILWKCHSREHSILVPTLEKEMETHAAKKKRRKKVEDD